MVLGGEPWPSQRPRMSRPRSRRCAEGAYRPGAGRPEGAYRPGADRHRLCVLSEHRDGLHHRLHHQRQAAEGRLQGPG